MWHVRGSTLECIEDDGGGGGGGGDSVVAYKPVIIVGRHLSRRAGHLRSATDAAAEHKSTA